VASRPSDKDKLETTRIRKLLDWMDRSVGRESCEQSKCEDNSREIGNPESVGCLSLKSVARVAT
jgi:hypothetical protein